MNIERMKEIKKEKGLSYRQIASGAGVPLSTVQKVFGGHTESPRYDTLAALDFYFLRITDEREQQKRSYSTGHFMGKARTYEDNLENSKPEEMASEENAGNLLKDTNEIQEKGGSKYPVCEGSETAKGVISKYQNHVREEAALYTYRFEDRDTERDFPNQGSYTVDDYYAIPDDRRTELIDGVFYDMTAPTVPHQLIGGEIYRLTANYIRSKKGKCAPFMSPIDVCLDRDDKTMLQPDVAVVCDRSKVIRRCIYGAPDFVVEVLSPSTARKDTIKKTQKYFEAGVREYWMVDLKQERIITYFFEEDEMMKIYGFHDSIPVRIFDSELVIDMGEIYDYVIEFELKD